MQENARRCKEMQGDARSYLNVRHEVLRGDAPAAHGVEESLRELEQAAEEDGDEAGDEEGHWPHRAVQRKGLCSNERHRTSAPQQRHGRVQRGDV